MEDAKTFLKENLHLIDIVFNRITNDQRQKLRKLCLNLTGEEYLEIQQRGESNFKRFKNIVNILPYLKKEYKKRCTRSYMMTDPRKWKIPRSRSPWWLSRLELKDWRDARGLDLNKYRRPQIIIPPELVSLDYITFYDNKNIVQIEIPKELISLTSLDCARNNLEELTIPSLEKLEIIRCPRNKLETLKIPQLPLLTELNCSRNNLKELILPKELPSLARFLCNNNELTTLTLPKELPSLAVFLCNNNELTTLTLPKELPKLVNFSYINNNIKEEIFILAPKLKWLNDKSYRSKSKSIEKIYRLFNYNLTSININENDTPEQIYEKIKENIVPIKIDEDEDVWLEKTFNLKFDKGWWITYNNEKVKVRRKCQDEGRLYHLGEKDDYDFEKNALNSVIWLYYLDKIGVGVKCFGAWIEIDSSSIPPRPRYPSPYYGFRDSSFCTLTEMYDCDIENYIKKIYNDKDNILYPDIKEKHSYIIQSMCQLIGKMVFNNVPVVCFDLKPENFVIRMEDHDIKMIDIDTIGCSADKTKKTKKNYLFIILVGILSNRTYLGDFGEEHKLFHQQEFKKQIEKYIPSDITPFKIANFLYNFNSVELIYILDHYSIIFDYYFYDDGTNDNWERFIEIPDGYDKEYGKKITEFMEGSFGAGFFP